MKQSGQQVLLIFLGAVCSLGSSFSSSLRSLPSPPSLATLHANSHPPPSNFHRVTPPPPSPLDLVQRDVFTSSTQDGRRYHCFGKPALLQVSYGTLLAFAEGRGGHSSDCSNPRDVEIVLKMSFDGGKTWSPLSVLHSEYPHNKIGNPAPVEDVLMGKIMVLFSHGEKSVLLVESRDGGHTWEGVTDITDMVGGGPALLSVTPGIPGGLRLPNGRLIFGISTMDKDGDYFSFAIYSDDHGKTWKRSATDIGGKKGRSESLSTKQCQIALLGVRDDGSVKELIVTVQTSKGRSIAYSNDTDDTGNTWSNLSMPTSLNPTADSPCTSGSSILSIPYDGVFLNTHLYLSQPLHNGNLTFFHSVDGGKMWKADYTLWSGLSGASSLTYDSEHVKVLCMFERGLHSSTEKITLAIFSPLI